jgi:hypothetical protein
MQMGEMLTATQSMSDEAVALLAEEIGPGSRSSTQRGRRPPGDRGLGGHEADRDEDLRPARRS